MMRDTAGSSFISVGSKESSYVTEGAFYREYHIDDFPEFLKISRKIFEKKFGVKSIPSNLTLRDFDLVRTIGIGTFSQVVLAKLKSTSTYHALKIMEKEQIVEMKAVDYILNEKRVLEAISFPFCVYLQHFFQDNCNLYLCMPFVNGGELFSHLKKHERFDEKTAAFYVAQIVVCFEYLHRMDLVYRDLKPENILLDSMGFIRLADFGFCKRLNGRTYTFCGTPEYIAPEVVLNKGYGFAVDWWAVGVITYELNAGYPPFQENDTLKLYENIALAKYGIPLEFSKELSSLVSSLLEKDITRRFGTLKNGVDDIKQHPWFNNTNWAKILQKSEEPPFSPTTKGPGDSSNYEKYDPPVLRTCNSNPYSHYFENF